MGPFLEFRLWLRDAPRVEVRGAALVAAALAALLAWTLVPTGRQAPATGAVAVGTAAVGAEPLDEVGAPTGETVPATGEAGAPNEGGSGPAVDASAPPEAAPASPSTPVPSPADPGGGAPASGPLTASDRGVEADAIRVGFTVLNLGGVDHAGYAADLRSDIPAVIDALVDSANQEGGVLGRQIEPVTVKVDILSADDQRRKCLQLTQTEKVFAVIDSYTYAQYEATKACITVENKTPLVTGGVGDAREVATAFPYEVSVTKDFNRRARDLVYAARDDGFFDPAKGFKKLGIFVDNCRPFALDDPATGLYAYLREVGVKSWSEFRTDCDIASQQRGGVQAALQHLQDGVSHVILGTIGAGVQNYTNTAQAQRATFEYFVSDFGSLANDGTAKNFNADQFDGTRGVTSLHEGERSIGRPLSASAAACSKILTDRGLEPITDYSRDSEALYLCDGLNLFLEAARRAGGDLTRIGWTDAVQTIVDFRPSWVDLASFGPGKLTGGDSVHRVQWHRDCVCFRQLEDFRPAYG